MNRLLIAVLLTTASVFAADATGAWVGFFSPTGESGARPLYFTLQQTGDALTGTGGPSAEQQLPLRNGKASASHLTFEVPEGDASFFFDLETSGDELQGTLEFHRGDEIRTATVSAKRAGK